MAVAGGVTDAYIVTRRVDDRTYILLQKVSRPRNMCAKITDGDGNTSADMFHDLFDGQSKATIAARHLGPLRMQGVEFES